MKKTSGKRGRGGKRDRSSADRFFEEESDNESSSEEERVALW
jgi:hypothetical protein